MFVVFVRPTTELLGYASFHSFPRKEPRTPGPTTRRSWLVGAPALAAAAAAAVAAIRGSTGEESRMERLAAAGATVGLRAAGEGVGLLLNLF